MLIWSIDRFGNSLVDLVAFMEMCRTAGVSVFMLEQGIDTETSNGMSMLDLTAMMALHLRQSRRDRILRGQAAARSLSIRFGRPPIPTAKIEKAKNSWRWAREFARWRGWPVGSARHPSRESRRPCVQRPQSDAENGAGVQSNGRRRGFAGRTEQDR